MIFLLLVCLFQNKMQEIQVRSTVPVFGFAGRRKGAHDCLDLSATFKIVQWKTFLFPIYFVHRHPFPLNHVTLQDQLT